MHAYLPQTGKDRTGLIAMLLQLIAGVPEEIVLQDYALTDIADPAKEMAAQKGANMGKNALNSQEQANMMMATEDNMEMTLHFFKRIWGSVEEYCTRSDGCGLTPAEYSGIQDLLRASSAAVPRRSSL